ncbi:hypothetical protein GPECTOR_11g29 [Gonium pectorale]|uniref:Uncharacterized protein n=1 Tax=Gonium pectorale TaxID=33097 RepID=A0A150GPW5_GONPE|nr:hypothetical protein GPECTOR_11g29 [Gonium pectorale]|eukprot:KXZ51851.1 hypothetical protein GPECTOR_11g29 [Gonium pectorale]
MGASPQAQARALLSKSAVYQRRNTATNVCLVVAPVFFCVLLAVLQLTPRFQRIEECTSLDTGYCERNRNATCRAFNDSNCSLRFSAPGQAVFCPIPVPSSWPAVLPSPRPTFRSGGSTGSWFPYTGSDMAAASAVAANLFTQPELPDIQPLFDLLRTSPLALLSLRPQQLLTLLLPVLAPGGLVSGDGESVDAAQLGRLGLTFGSGLRANNDYYLENAFINSNSNTSRVQLLVPWGFCSAAGIANVTNNFALPITEMLLRYYNYTYPLLRPLFRALNVTPDTLSPAAVGDSLLSGITAACVDALPYREANGSGLDRRLYCGFGSARCDGTFFIREYGAAWDFKKLSPTELKYDAYYNLTLPQDDPVNYRLPALLSTATKAWTRTYWGNLTTTGRLRNRLLGVMSFPKLAFKLKLDFSVLLGPLFYTWVIQMLMPSLLQQLVYEKEKRLRMMMKMHGLGDGAYWLVTYLWYLMLYIAYMIFFVVFGSLIRLKIFTTNSYTLQAVLYFIFGNNMIAFMFCLSSLFSSSRTATVVAFLYVFASGLIGELLLRPLMQENRGFILAVQLLPGFSLYRGLFEFSEYSIRSLFANTEGLRWAGLHDPGNGMLSAWAILAAEWPVFMLLGWYLEQPVLGGSGSVSGGSPLSRSSDAVAAVVGSGEREASGSPPWCGAARVAAAAVGSGASGSDGGAASASRGSGSDARIVVRPASPASPASPTLAKALAAAAADGAHKAAGGGDGYELRTDAADVAAETGRVAAMDEAALAGMPIVIKGLAKLFPTDRGRTGGGNTGGDGGGGGWRRLCCGVGVGGGAGAGAKGGGGRGGAPPPRGRLAVRSLTLAIERGECFGLLGPNGAGKTTTIHMLTGFLEPSAGDALVEGRSVRSRMPEIYRMMGVCPQDNLLWEQLTGEEHLLFYGRLKGLKEFCFDGSM